MPTETLIILAAIAYGAYVLWSRFGLVVPAATSEAPSFSSRVPTTGQAVEALDVIRARLLASGVPSTEVIALLSPVAAALHKE